MDLKDKIKIALEFDPLDTAEKITGKSYKNNEGVAFLGMLMQMDSSEIKRDLLKENNDVWFNMPLNEYILQFMKMGFKLIYEEPFKSKLAESNEYLYCYWHKELNVLLVFDTFFGAKSLNGGHFYYNWKPNDKSYYLYGRSGHCNDDNIWIGYNDCREAVKYYLDEMKEKGKFISPWVERPFLWIVHHQDYEDDRETNFEFHYLYRKTEERIKKFPKEIQILIPPRKKPNYGNAKDVESMSISS